MQEGKALSLPRDRTLAADAFRSPSRKKRFQTKKGKEERGKSVMKEKEEKQVKMEQEEKKVPKHIQKFLAAEEKKNKMLQKEKKKRSKPGSKRWH